MHVTITDGSFSFRGQATHRVDCLVDAPCDLLTLLKPSCNMMKMSGDSCTMKSHWRTSLGCPRVYRWQYLLARVQRSAEHQHLLVGCSSTEWQESPLWHSSA